MNNYPSSLLQRAVGEVSRLPGIGQRTALRLVLHLLRQDLAQTEALSESLLALRREVHYCRVCHNICDGEVCDICASSSRDATQVCVVENIQDVMAIEATQQYRGLYHVLGGIISPMEGVGPADLEIQSLVERVGREHVAEVILALSSTMEGDATGFYIYRRLQDYDVRVTVIARGVAQNDELQYTDEVTLGRALQGRVPFST
ncbi:MAG: recombination mediator RecR [Bacteroidaceae bacterium]|nr:recombination mediator RecR [Bacteroidaceae bacterium]